MSAIPVHFRRSLVLAGVAFAIALGAITIRVAAAWTASAAPLSDTPVSAEQLKAQLAGEQSRSAALQQQLQALTDQSTQLTNALAAAQTRIEQDTRAATALRSQLDAAKKRLAALHASTQLVSSVAAAPVATPASGGTHEAGGDD